MPVAPEYRLPDGPGPDEIDEHHRITAGRIGEIVPAGVAIERQHRERRGQDREGRDDKEAGGERGPAEDRHAQVTHAGTAHLEHRRDDINAGDQRADARYLYRPEVIIDADAGRIGRLAQGRIG